MAEDRIPKKLRALRMLCDHLEQTPGYDLTGRVWRGRKTLPVDDASECMSVLESPRPVTGDVAGAGQGRAGPWTLLVQGWPVDDKDNPSDPAYFMAAAVEQHLFKIVQVDKNSGNAVYPELYRLGNTISGMTISQSLVRPPEEGVSRLAMFYIPLVIELAIDLSDPYR